MLEPSRISQALFVLNTPVNRCYGAIISRFRLETTGSLQYNRYNETITRSLRD